MCRSPTLRNTKYKNSKILVYLTQQCQFTSNFHKINKQKHCRWIMWNKLNAKSVVLLHEYMYRDVYATHQLCVIDDAKDRKRPQ